MVNWLYRYSPAIHYGYYIMNVSIYPIHYTKILCFENGFFFSQNNMTFV